MEKVKVLQIAALDYSFRVHLLPLARIMKNNGYHVFLCGGPSSSKVYYERAGFPYLEIPFSRDFNFFNHFRCQLKLIQLFNREQFDIIHSHTVIAGLLARIAAFITRTPISVYTSHGIHYRFYRDGSKWKYFFFWFVEWLGGRLSDFIFFQNDNDRQLAINSGIISPEKSITIGNGVNLDRFNPDKIKDQQQNDLIKELGIPDTSVVITYIGRPTFEKGFDLFLKLLQLLKSTHKNLFFLIIINEIEGEKNQIEVPSTLREINNLVLLGYRDDIPALLSLADILLFPTRWEGLSKIMIEAMCMGLVVVASNINGCQELIHHQETGILVPCEDISSFNTAVNDLLDDESSRHRIGENATHYAQTYFNEANSLNIQMKIFQQLRAEILEK